LIDSDTSTIEFTIEADKISVFLELLSCGFKLEIQTESSLYHILCSQVGIKEDYLNNRVQTIFLNGKAVDDIFTEIVKNNAVIALSAAMPGLAGAIFRKQGILSSLRTDFSADKKENPEKKQQQGIIVLKLFNLIASDLGSDFLQKGIMVNGDHLSRFIIRKRLLLESVVSGKKVNGKLREIDDTLDVCIKDRDLILILKCI